MRKAVVGVMGGARVDRAVEEAARELGSLIARRGWVLLNGGRDVGVMAASAAGARQEGGLVIGVLPGDSRIGASPDLDVAIVTGMGDARNVINVLSCDVVIACPGSVGTMSEIVLALKNGKPVISLQAEPQPPEWGGVLDRFRQDGLLTAATTPTEAVRRAAEILKTADPQ